MMKFLCVLVLCTVGVAAVLKEQLEEKEEDGRLLMLLKELFQEKENKEVDTLAEKIRPVQRKKSLEKRGSYCYPDPNCVFPFVYNDVEYSSCITVDAGYHWCSHAATYSSAEGYSRCACLGCEPATSCVFPFTYKGVEHLECTDADHNQAWCSPTEEYAEGSGTYQNCNCKRPDITPACEPSAFCVFPFTYEGVSYTECTDVGHDKAWCSPTEDYVVGSNTYIECDCVSCNKPPECDFPFEYNNKLYHECTKANSAGYWCAKTTVYSSAGGYASCTCSED